MGGIFSAPKINMPTTEPVIAPAPASEEAVVVKAMSDEEEAMKKKTQQSQGAKSLSIPIGTV